jgi:hypothetical protein
MNDDEEEETTNKDSCLVLNSAFISMLFIVRCLLMISGLYSIWMSDTMRNSCRRSGNRKKKFSFSLYWHYATTHLSTFSINVNEWSASTREIWRYSYICVCMFFLSLSQFSTQTRGKNWDDISFFPSFFSCFSFSLFVTTTHIAAN